VKHIYINYSYVFHEENKTSSFLKLKHIAFDPNINVWNSSTTCRRRDAGQAGLVALLQGAAWCAPAAHVQGDAPALAALVSARD
jgi:hypothetical protein